ncbi:hypothetical protein J6Z48_03010 [bacterium]|nr:hypothetical protein [bacterium]
MSKIDLKTTFALPIVYENKDFPIGKNFSYKEKTIITIDDIRDQLLNEELDCPEVFYTKYKYIDSNSVFSNKKIKVNIYVMEPNLAGIEYVKTKVSRCKQYPKVIEVLYGAATILLQKYTSPLDNIVMKYSLKKGDKGLIPAGYDYVAVNPRQNATLILAEYSNIDAISRTVLDDNSGLAYYVIRKNAKQEVVRNPNYKIVSPVKKVSMSKIIEKYGITQKTPFSKQLLKNITKYDWLFQEDSVSI